MKKIILLSFVIFAFIACTNQREADLSLIKSTEKELFDSISGGIIAQKADELSKLYLNFAEKYPKDTLSASMYFKAAEVLMNIEKYQQSVDALEKLIANFPENNLIANAIHFKGFIYEDKLNDLEKARSAYQEVINRFPNSDLANNVQASIDNLGRSPEEVIKMFEEKQRIEDSLSKLVN